jgi:hypothetical protein
MNLLKGFSHNAVRVRRLGAICLILPVALLSACDRSDEAATQHSHAPGQDHAAASPAKSNASYTCPMHPEVQQAAPGKCPKCGMELVQPSGANGGKEAHGGHGTAQATVSVTAATAQPLKAGEKAEVHLMLKKQEGSPVALDDLKEAHTEKIHVLIIDPTLTDYHHEHPVPGTAAGEYQFSFTPRTAGPYRLWADLVPVATGKQEYVIADLGGTAPNAKTSNRSPNLTTIVDGLTYAVAFEQPLKAGSATLGKLTIKDANKAVFTNLEPIMGAYAHLVGFSEDYRTIAHIHPMGEEPKNPSDRGAGDLQFHIQPEKAGLVRLFAQVQIGGQSKFAMFTLEVSP